MLQWAVATNLSWLPLMWGAVLHGHWGWLTRSFKLRFLSLKPQKSVLLNSKTWEERCDAATDLEWQEELRFNSGHLSSAPDLLQT